MSTVEAPASHLPLPMQNILSRLAANSTEAEQALVRKAYAYAAAAHAGQVRLSGEPYLSHPLAVAEVLAKQRSCLWTAPFRSPFKLSGKWVIMKYD